MIIDKKINLDKELEYFADGEVAFAQNIVVSNDGLTIQNEPAIVKFIEKNEFDLVGFVACDEEFVLFSSDNKIVRINKKAESKLCNTNWEWCRGEVFGVFSYNVNNELIIAISERNLPIGIDCPVKIINLDRDGYIEGATDNIYTLTPDIPQSNMINFDYVSGNKVKKGKYNFFIKYHINDNFETAWFPIGVPIFFYDNTDSRVSKTIDLENIQAVGELGDTAVPKTLAEYKIAYSDYYNEDSDYTDNNVVINFEINNKGIYTHCRIGFIINTASGIEARQLSKTIIPNNTNNIEILVDENSEAISVDELTVGAFNIYNVKTMCNYKDRLYLANYKEENRNVIVNNIDVSGITVSYSEDDVFINADDVFRRSRDLKKQYYTKPGRAAVYNFFIHYVYPNGNYTDGIRIDNNGNGNLAIFTNSKNENLFATPVDSSFNISKLRFDGIKMYPEFVGYFISYEKPEYINIGEGLLIPKTENYSEGENEQIKYTFAKDLFVAENDYTNSIWKFYYPEFNIIGGKTNITKLIESAVHTPKSGYINAYVVDHIANTIKYTENTSIDNGTTYGVSTTEIVSPSNFNNIGKEGYLEIEFHNNYTISQADGIKSFIAIDDSNNNLYLSDTKKLISLGYIKYESYDELNPDNAYTYGYEDVLYNYDFYKCFSSIPFARGSGVIINQTESNHINAYSGEDFYPDVSPTPEENAENPLYPHIGIVQYWHETHYPLFLKEINKAPEKIFYSYYKVIKAYNDKFDAWYVKSVNQYQKASLVLNVNDINDLYKLDSVYYDYTGKLLTNYDKTLYSNALELYTKTIRRSDVLQSESVVNSWKLFRPENYKIITEDKGAINNIVGIGNYLFVHCEHSLFLFDVTDSLQALDKNVQLLQPDSFEVAYKEVFTADKGYGGIQDHESWICDEFGYIFFDKSAKKIYRFDGGQLKDMTEGIDNFIKIIKPEHIWFGNDRERNRIMINIQSVDDNVMLSYTLLGNGWSSTHSYISNYKFIGLKDKLFIPNVIGNNLNISHYIDTEFNKFTLPVGNIDNDGSFKSFIDVVFNSPNYNKIKVLDFITYILNKEPADNFEILTLEIYTNCCYSGVIDISQERKKVTEYKKPYYDFERWNFNWFRNVIDKIENGDVVDRPSGRIHTYPQKVQRGYDNALISGKYVVIRFNFKLVSKQVNIKDIHAYFKP